LRATDRVGNVGVWDETAVVTTLKREHDYRACWQQSTASGLRCGTGTG